MLRLLTVATPLTQATVRVPESVPPPPFVPIDIVIEPFAVVTTVPVESSMATWTGARTAPAAVLVGPVVKPSFEGAPCANAGVAQAARAATPKKDGRSWTAQRERLRAPPEKCKN